MHRNWSTASHTHSFHLSQPSEAGLHLPLLPRWGDRQSGQIARQVVGKEPSQVLAASRHLAVTLPIFSVYPMASNDSMWPLCPGTCKSGSASAF